MRRLYRREIVALGSVACTAVLSCWWLASERMASSAVALRADEARHAQALADARAILTMRAENAESVSPDASPRSAVSEALRRVLVQAGAPAGAFAGVSASAPQQTADPARVLERLTVTLEGIRPDELARCLAAWTQQEAAWTVAGVSLAHLPQDTRRSDPYAAIEPVYLVHLTLEHIRPRSTPRDSTP